MDIYVSTDKSKINFDKMTAILNSTYWAALRTKEEVRVSVENSVCYGAYIKDTDEMIGITRVITDFATTCYICDVIVDEKYRRLGVGEALMNAVVSDSTYDGMKKMLITKDAHKFYEKFGFVKESERYMWINNE